MRNHPYIEGHQAGQLSYLPECLDELIEAENSVRLIRAFVSQLDLGKMGFERNRPRETGRPGYAPSLLLGLYIYGHMNRIRSSRMLERECKRNLELWWLMDRLQPDHNTISDFRRDNRKAIEKLLKQFVRLCVEMGLVKGSRICVDGTPVKAVTASNSPPA